MASIFLMKNLNCVYLCYAVMPFFFPAQQKKYRFFLSGFEAILPNFVQSHHQHIITMPINIEIKARSAQHDALRAYLQQQSARLAGTDFQTDTYFRVPHGRLKLRQGNVENALIHYHRDNEAEPGKSEVLLYEQPGESLLPLLSAALGVLVQVKKKREIYFIENVKFHLDEVVGLGTFVEIEAQDHEGLLGEMELHAQCRYYMEALGIHTDDLVAVSYSDMMLQVPGESL